MATYYVTKVRKANGSSAGGTPHEHIVGVVTTSELLYENQEVVDSIGAGNEWYTQVHGQPNAKIRRLARCPFASGCPQKPYLTTEPDHTEGNNLENLPRG